MKQDYKIPRAALYSLTVSDILAASDEPDLPQDPDDDIPGDTPTPAPGINPPSILPSDDPTAPDIDWS